MNKAILIGNLTKNPELRTTSSGISVCNFTIAVNSGFGDNKRTDYLHIVTWRGLADNCKNYLKKGSKVGVMGRIQVRNYDDANGDKKYITEIVADDVEFLTPKGIGGSGTPNAFQQDFVSADNEDFSPLSDDEMPF